MIEIHMQQVDLNLHIDRDSGIRTMRFVDPESGIIVRVDVPEDAAKTVGTALVGSPIEVAKALPKEPVQH